MSEKIEAKKCNCCSTTDFDALLDAEVETAHNELYDESGAYRRGSIDRPHERAIKSSADFASDVAVVKKNVAEFGLDCAEAVASLSSLIKAKTYTTAAVSIFNNVSDLAKSGLALPKLTALSKDFGLSFTNGKQIKDKKLTIEQITALIKAAKETGIGFETLIEAIDGPLNMDLTISLAKAAKETGINFETTTKMVKNGASAENVVAIARVATKAIHKTELFEAMVAALGKCSLEDIIRHGTTAAKTRGSASVFNALIS